MALGSGGAATLATLATLMVKINADSSGMESGLKSATEKLNKFGNIAMGVGGGIVTAFGALIKESVDAGSAMNDMSERTGVAVEDLSRMGYVAKQVGASSEGLEISMKNLAIRMDDNAQKGVNANDAFTRLGISVVGTDGKMKSVTQVMLEVAEKLSGIESSATKTGIAADLFGARAGTQLLPMLALGAGGMQTYMNKADELGITMSTKSAQSADKFGDSLEDIQGAMVGITRSIAEVLIPALQPLIEETIKIIKKIKEWRDEHPALFEAIMKLAAVGGPILLLVGAASKVVAIIGMAGGAGSIIGAFSALLPFLGPLGLIAVGIAAVYLIWKNWDKIKEWVGGAWDSVKNFASGAWDSIKTFATNTWESVKGWATNTYDTVKGWAQNAGDKLKGFASDAWTWAKQAWGNYEQVTNEKSATIFTTVKGFFSNMGEKFSGWGKDAKNWATDFWEKYQTASEEGNKKFYSWLGGAFEKVTGFFANLRNNSYKWGYDLFSSMWDGLKAMWTSVYAWVLGVGDSIVNFFANLVARIQAFFAGLWAKAAALVAGEEEATGGGGGNVQAYQSGGIVRSTGLALVHEGETVLPKGVQPVQIQFGDIVFSEPTTPVDMKMKARDLADLMIDEMKRRGIQLA